MPDPNAQPDADRNDTPNKSIPEAGPEPEPHFDEPAKDPPGVVDAPARSDEF